MSEIEREIARLHERQGQLDERVDNLHSAVFGGNSMDEPGLLNAARAQKDLLLDVRKKLETVSTVQEQHKRIMWTACGVVVAFNLFSKFLFK